MGSLRNGSILTMTSRSLAKWQDGLGSHSPLGSQTRVSSGICCRSWVTNSLKRSRCFCEGVKSQSVFIMATEGLNSVHAAKNAGICVAASAKFFCTQAFGTVTAKLAEGASKRHFLSILVLG